MSIKPTQVEKIEKKIEEEMNTFTVTDIVSAKYAFAALAHDRNDPTKTKVLVFGRSWQGGKIEKKIYANKKKRRSITA